MIRWLFFALVAGSASAQDVPRIVTDHILPGYSVLAQEAAELAEAAQADCRPQALTAPFHDAFDAWVEVSHLRFGPSEVDDRAFALAFWPDPRGSTPKTLASLLTEDVSDPVAFAQVSVAARGFYALEFLLFDPQFIEACALTQAVTADIAANAAAILADWQGGYADLMTTPGNDTYRTGEETLRQLFTALSTGLEFTSLMRLGRPLGSFDRPRPKRAEARRSARSLRHLILSLESTAALGALLVEDTQLDAAFDAATARAKALNDPTFASVADPLGRVRIEALQQSVDTIRTLLAVEVGPRLGVAAGFNALDGD